MKKNFPNSHPDDPNHAFNRALRYLSLRARSKKEIEEYLTNKKFDSQAISQAVDRLVELKFLDDAEFGKSWIKNRQERKGKSKYFIRYELKRKGLAEDLIDVLSDEAQADLKTARDFVERKRRVYGKLDKIEFREKIAKQLQSRGFSWDIVREAIKDKD